MQGLIYRATKEENTCTRCSVLGSRCPSSESSSWLFLITEGMACHFFFSVCTRKPFHCMGILDCFSCMLSGHILYGYFVLLMVNWKENFVEKKWRRVLCFSQSIFFLNKSRYVLLNGVSVCHSMLLRIECQFHFLMYTLPQCMSVLWCGKVQDVLSFLFEMLCGFCHKATWW